MFEFIVGALTATYFAGLFWFFADGKPKGKLEWLALFCWPLFIILSPVSSRIYRRYHYADRTSGWIKDRHGKVVQVDAGRYHKARVCKTHNINEQAVERIGSFRSYLQLH